MAKRATSSMLTHDKLALVKYNIYKSVNHSSEWTEPHFNQKKFLETILIMPRPIDCTISIIKSHLNDTQTVSLL
jgi:hypothetical protein